MCEGEETMYRTYNLNQTAAFGTKTLASTSNRNTSTAVRAVEGCKTCLSQWVRHYGGTVGLVGLGGGGWGGGLSPKIDAVYVSIINSSPPPTPFLSPPSTWTMTTMTHSRGWQRPTG